MHIEQSDFHDQFVRGLTHKMNNILSLFHGYIALLMEDKKLDAETQDGLRRIKEGAHVASELMDRSKALARPASLVWREIDIAKFLRTLAPTFESLLERGARFEINLAENLPNIWTDASRLKTAVLELVQNACEASPAGGLVTISARTESVRRRGAKTAAEPIEWLAIEIADEGAGVSTEIAEKVFDPFFSTKRRKRAMGLGLTVAAGLAQQLAGVVRFDSQPGKTCFRLLLPVRSKEV